VLCGHPGRRAGRSPFIPRCHRRIISPRARPDSPPRTRRNRASPAANRYVGRVINTARLGLRFRKIAPRRRERGVVSRRFTSGTGCKNERERLCMMIKKHCLPNAGALPSVVPKSGREGKGERRGERARASRDDLINARVDPRPDRTMFEKRSDPACLSGMELRCRRCNNRRHNRRKCVRRG